jgi:hypothetical protein
VQTCGSAHAGARSRADPGRQSQERGPAWRLARSLLRTHLRRQHGGAYSQASARRVRPQAEPRMWASGGSRWVLLGPFVQAHRSNLITGWFLYMRPAESGLSAVGGARQACSFGNWRRAACVGAGLGPATLRDGTLGQAPATLRPPAREARSGGRTTVMAHRRAAASACCGSARGRVWPAVPFR